MRNGRIWGDGRLFQRPRSPFWWCAYHLRGREYRESTAETDEKKAQKYLNRKLKEIHADQIGARVFVTPKQERITVSELLDALVTRYELKGKRSPQFDSHLARIRVHFGYMRAIDVTAEMADCYIKERKRQARPATVNRETQLLGQAFRLAVKRRHLTTIPRTMRGRDLSAAWNSTASSPTYPNTCRMWRCSRT
jgi:hypothetical protein